MPVSSTPRRQRDNRRRSLLNVSVASVFSPLRKNDGAAADSSLLGRPADDEEERSNRRSMVALQRRLTNVATSNQSPLVDLNPMEESQMKDHLKICAKLYTENRISVKNAWELHVIDVMRKITAVNDPNALQLAGSSLDISSKVYSLRVDDVHSKGLQLASTLAKGSEKLPVEDGGEEGNLDMSINQQEKRKTNKRKQKKLSADKRRTVDKEGKTLYAPIKQVESVLFATKENIEVSAIDNLLTSKLLTNPANHELMLLKLEKFWSLGNDEVLRNCDLVLEIELPHISNFCLCMPFKEFETGMWDPEEEERLLAEASALPDVVLDDRGLPIAELDGSIHDIFEENQDDHVHEESTSDVEGQQEVFQAQIQGGIRSIVDTVPEESRRQTEYGFNEFVRTPSGKYIERLWAGPSHWKVKFNRRSTARFSGASQVQAVVKHTRKIKEPQRIDFIQEKKIPDITEKFVIKRAPRTTTFEKITFPVPELDVNFENFLKVTSEFLMRPGVKYPISLNNLHLQRDYEVNVYNYENPNDSLYCSQQNNDDGEPLERSFDEELSPVPQQQFAGLENLVNAPDLVASTNIRYAMQAKKMDMKKLKAAIWKHLTQNSEASSEGRNQTTVRPTNFSTLYISLPQMLNPDMRKDLTCPLAVVALLHLCNEQQLELQAKGDYKDFKICKATLCKA